MAGHSQFKNIMHRKGAQDAKRAKIFTKLSKEISVAVKEGGDNPEFNPRLRTALMAAKDSNMPKDNIEKAIKKAIGGEHDNFEQITYEGYAPYGVAVIVETLTNNRNRTASDIRAIFNKYNGNLGASGSVSFLFDHSGIIKFNKNKISFNQLFEVAVKYDAKDVIEEEDSLLVITEPSDLYKITTNIANELKIEVELSEFTFLAKTTVVLNKEQEDTVLKIINALEEHDDIQKVFSNAELT